MLLITCHLLYLLCTAGLEGTFCFLFCTCQKTRSGITCEQRKIGTLVLADFSKDLGLGEENLWSEKQAFL